MQRLRTARRLTFRLREGSIVGVNPSYGTARRMPPSLINLLARTEDWVEQETLASELEQLTGEVNRGRDALNALVAEGFLLAEGSEAAAQEGIFEEAWPFGESTADHYVVTHSLRFSDDRSEAVAYGRLLAKHAEDKLVGRGDDSVTAISLPHELDEAFESILAKRRSRRDFTEESIDITEVGGVLWAGAGVQKYREIPGRPSLPLTFAPSAGGLNGIDLYVLASNVSGLPEGAYRYLAADSALEPLASDHHFDAQFLIGNQRWASTAGLIILMIGNVSRTAWKYDAASGFNAMLIQAGHIGQNILLAASQLSLGAVPSNALHVGEIEKVLGLTVGKHVVLSCIGIGRVQGEVSSYDEYLPSDLAVLRKMSEL